MNELGKRAVSCKHWRWMPGMLARYGDGKCWYRLSEADCYGIPSTFKSPNPRLGCVPPLISLDSTSEGGRVWPDFTDPATLGCLMALVIEAYKDLVVISRGSGWWCVETDAARWDDDDTESFPEALLKALEAAEEQDWSEEDR